MNNKKSRLNEIVEILTHNTISSQEELLERLACRGIKVTQATLSRDLKRLRTIKVAGERGEYRYVMTGASTWTAGAEESLSADNTGDLAPASGSPQQPLSMSISGNMIVLKTRNGFAGGLAYDLDMLDAPCLLGTIAGADTVFVVISQSTSPFELIEALAPVVPRDILTRAIPSI